MDNITDSMFEGSGEHFPQHKSIGFSTRTGNSDNKSLEGAMGTVVTIREDGIHVAVHSLQAPTPSELR